MRSGSGTFFRRKRLIGRARRDPSEEKSTAAEVLTSADFCGHDDGCVPKEPSAAVEALAPEAPCGTRFWIRPPNPVTAFPHNVTHTTRKSPGGEMLRRGLCCSLVCPLRASLLRSVRNRGGHPPEACRGALYSVPVTEDLFRRLRRRDMVPLSRNEQTWWTVYGFFATLSGVFFTNMGSLSLLRNKNCFLHDFRPCFVGPSPLPSQELSPVCRFLMQ